MTNNIPGPAETERFEIIRTLDELEAAGPAWRALWEHSGAPIFQSHAWIMGWWSTIPDQEDLALMIVLAWRGANLRAVLPLVTRKRRGMRVLEWAARDYVDYCDALVHRGDNLSVLRRMWAYLSREGGFDLAHLSRLMPGASALTLLEREKGSVGLRVNRRTDQSQRVVGPWPSGEAWFETHNKKTRQNYRRGVKALEEGATLSFRLLPPDAPLEPVLERLSTLKRLWLAKNGIEAPLFDAGSPTLLALVQALAEAGQLRIFVLERDDVIIALSVNFVQGDTMMAFLTTYDPAVERGSPGMVLMVDYIKWAADHGLTTVDFLCGDEDFKGRFATQTVMLTSITGSRTMLGHAALLADQLVFVARRLRNWRPVKPVEPGFA